MKTDGSQWLPFAFSTYAASGIGSYLPLLAFRFRLKLAQPGWRTLT
jgi:hypothetical protein